ncbi:MAG: MarR family transcriptional regulator [Phycisphaerales bacterium]|nr:MarR family transcriptional regulator [Phycisphaerales bacterium]
MNTTSHNCAAALLEAIPLAMRDIRQHMRRHRLAGMSVPQFRILRFLDCNGPATLSAAAEHVGTTLPSASRMAQSLVEARLIRRHAGQPDRRTVRLEITAKGRQILTAARKATLNQLQERLDKLSSDDVTRLHSAMELVLQVFAGNTGSAVTKETVQS